VETKLQKHMKVYFIHFSTTSWNCLTLHPHRIEQTLSLSKNDSKINVKQQPLTMTDPNFFIKWG